MVEMEHGQHRGGKPLPGSLGEEKAPPAERFAVLVGLVIVSWVVVIGLVVGTVQIIRWLF